MVSGLFVICFCSLILVTLGRNSIQSDIPLERASVYFVCVSLNALKIPFRLECNIVSAFDCGATEFFAFFAFLKDHRKNMSN